jgi:hypothetical protein
LIEAFIAIVNEDGSEVNWPGTCDPLLILFFEEVLFDVKFLNSGKSSERVISDDEVPGISPQIWVVL